MPNTDPVSDPTAAASEPAGTRITVDQRVGAINGGKVVGVEVHHAETVIIEAGQPAAPPEPGEPPYKGLDFYDVADAPLFFGRERLTAELVAFVRDHAFLAIVGASGSGKSSLARAGLIAAFLGKTDRPLEGGVQPPLGSRDWRYVAVTPTAHPFEALARGLAGDGADGVALLAALSADPLALAERVPALTGADGRLLLLVDQFEELFTLCKDARERAAYVTALLAACGEPAFGSAGSPCTVILTVRADFYGQCISFENLRAALETHQKPIGAMNRAELQRTIELPARAGQWAFQQGLVEQILDDVGNQPGSLPLLSYALLETWNRRSGRVMTLAGYQAAGGVRDAINRTAERVFDDLTQQGLGDVARRIFLSLVEPADAGRATRRREQLRTLAPEDSQSPEARALLALSARDARLVTVDGESVQISHEALITAWPKLGEWLRTYHDDLQLLQSVRDAAAAWATAPETEKQDLLAHRGGRLDDAVKLRDVGEFPIDERERVYLDACVALRDREQAAERKRQRDRFRLIAGAAVVALVLALLAGVFGIRAQNSANTAATREAEAQVAKSGALAASTREAKALSSRADAVATSEAAVAEARSNVEKREALVATVQASDPFVRVLGNQFVLAGMPFKFIGVTSQGLIHYGYADGLSSATTADIETQLQAAHEMGARVVQMWVPHSDISADEAILRLERVLDLIRSRYPDMYLLPVLSTAYGDTSFRVAGDDEFYSVRGASGFALTLGPAFYGRGYQKNFLPFAEKAIKRFRAEPHIFAWQIGSGLALPEDPDLLVRFIHTVADEIKKWDPNHLVTAGIESTRHAGLNNSEARAFLYGPGNLQTGGQSYGTSSVDFLSFSAYLAEGAPVEDDSDLAQQLEKPFIIETGIQGSRDADRSPELRDTLSRWFAQNGSGFLQWGFMATQWDNGDGDYMLGMDRTLHSDWYALFEVYREQAQSLSRTE